MSKILTIGESCDAAGIYKCVKALAELHGEDASYFKMSEDKFVKEFGHNFLTAHLYKENKQDINGLILHMKEYSINFNSFGAYIEDLYLDSTSRGKGLSRKMLAELCEYLLNNNQKYLKIIIPDYLHLDKFYKNFNFVNYSDNLFLYESLRSNLQAVWTVIDELPNAIVFHRIQKENAFPIFQVAVTRGSQAYAFCCQFYFHSWGGYGILFTDFSGDTTIARLSDFRKSGEALLHETGWSEDTIIIFWWQLTADQQHVANCIKSCNAENLCNHGWKIYYLNEDGMRKLSNSVDKA